MCLFSNRIIKIKLKQNKNKWTSKNHQACCWGEKAEWIHKYGVVLLGDSHFHYALSFYFYIRHAMGIFYFIVFIDEKTEVQAYFLPHLRAPICIWIQVSLQSHLSSARVYQEGNTIVPLIHVSVSNVYKVEVTITSHVS